MDDMEQAERLANTYADAILRLSYTYLKNTHDAQDICQTVFVKLLMEPREFKSPEHERAYILRMAANVDRPHDVERLQGPAEKPLAAAVAIPGCRTGGPRPPGGRRVCAGGGKSAAAPLPGRHLPVLLRGLPGCRDRSNPGHPHRNRPHPAGPGTDEAERTFGRIWL